MNLGLPSRLTRRLESEPSRAALSTLLPAIEMPTTALREEPFRMTIE